MTCFVIGPIGDVLAPAGSPARQTYENSVQTWAKVFQPACAQFGLDAPVRADKISETGEITEQIFTILRDADVVIADVSGGNANVMYELGLRHTRPNQITIPIGENERLPFDVTTIRTIKFARTEAGLIDAREALVAAIRAALNGGGTPVTATRVWNDAPALNPDQVAQATALSATDDEAGLDDDEDGEGRLELLAAGEQSMEDLAGHLGALGQQMAAMGGVADEYTPQMEAAESFGAKLTVTRRFADALQVPATAMDTESNDYLHAVENIDAMMGIIIDEVAKQEEGSEGADEGLLSSVIYMAEQSESASISTIEFRGIVRHMRTWSRVLKPVSASIEHSLNTVLRANEIVFSWATRLRALPDWVEPPPYEADDGESDADDLAGADSEA